MSNLKVLPLHKWQASNSAFNKTLRNHTLFYYKKTEPYYNRAGIYKLRDECWFELEDGRAYKYKGDNFDFEYLVMELSEYDPSYLKELIKAIDKFKNVLEPIGHFKSSYIGLATKVALQEGAVEFRLSRYKDIKRMKGNMNAKIKVRGNSKEETNSM